MDDDDGDDDDDDDNDDHAIICVNVCCTVCFLTLIPINPNHQESPAWLDSPTRTDHLNHSSHPS